MVVGQYLPTETIIDSQQIGIDCHHQGIIIIINHHWHQEITILLICHQLSIIDRMTWWRGEYDNLNNYCSSNIMI